MYVQYGSGPLSAPEGWVSFDASMTLKFERIPLVGRMYTKNANRFPATTKWGDITRGLPVPAGGCVGVYASHVLEHLALSDFHQALINTKLIMRQGGIFRVIVPDLESAARSYIKNIDADEEEANSAFLREVHLGMESRRRGVSGLFYNWLNTSRHLWMWDKASLTAALRNHGFASIRTCNFGDCEDRMFERVEDHGRFVNAVAIEAKA